MNALMNVETVPSSIWSPTQSKIKILRSKRGSKNDCNQKFGLTQAKNKKIDTDILIRNMSEW